MLVVPRGGIAGKPPFSPPSVPQEKKEVK